MTDVKDLYALGETPPLGHVPPQMHAWAIRKDRHGPPEQSMRIEVVPTWPIGEDEVLILVMAAGVNYNGIWAGLALAVLMLPTVTRTTEVVLRLVPGGLREAGLALGATEWSTTKNVVVPTARAGIVTAVILGVGLLPALLTFLFDQLDVAPR